MNLISVIYSVATATGYDMLRKDTHTVYKQQFTQDQLDRLQGGDRKLLLELLHSSDSNIIKDMKVNPNSGDIRFLQGASHVIDNLLKVLEPTNT